MCKQNDIKSVRERVIEKLRKLTDAQYEEFIRLCLKEGIELKLARTATDDKPTSV